MNKERRVSEMEMRWTLETDEQGRERLVAHWVSTETPDLTARVAA